MRAEKAVLFDLDGTLIDSFADIAAAVNGALADHGLPERPLAEIKGMVGSGIAELCRRAAPTLGEEELGAFIETVRRHYTAHPVRFTTMYDGVLAALDEVRRRGYASAVLSNKPHLLTVRVCEALEISPRVDEVQGEFAPAVPRKPDPAGARAVLRRLGAVNAVVVGDMIQDALLARSLAAPLVGVLWSGAGAEVLRPFHPIALCQHPSELPDAIDRAFAWNETTTTELPST